MSSKLRSLPNATTANWPNLTSNILKFLMILSFFQICPLKSYTSKATDPAATLMRTTPGDPADLRPGRSCGCGSKPVAFPQAPKTITSEWFLDVFGYFCCFNPVGKCRKTMVDRRNNGFWNPRNPTAGPAVPFLGMATLLSSWKP